MNVGGTSATFFLKEDLLSCTSNGASTPSQLTPNLVPQQQRMVRTQRPLLVHVWGLYRPTFKKPFWLVISGGFYWGFTSKYGDISCFFLINDGFSDSLGLFFSRANHVFVMITWAIFLGNPGSAHQEMPWLCLISAWWCNVSSLKNDGVKVKWEG